MIVKNKIIAHRGASMYAPENSASSLKLASSMGVEWIETDVQITRDNQLVIFHDEKLERTSNGEGFLALKKFSELKKVFLRIHKRQVVWLQQLIVHWHAQKSL